MRRYEGLEPGTHYVSGAPSDEAEGGSVEVVVKVGDDGTYETANEQEQHVLERVFKFTGKDVKRSSGSGKGSS